MKEIDYKIILTGGYANLFKKIIKRKTIIDKNITLLDKLINYMLIIDSTYNNDNPHHNHIHACDVLLNMHYFILSDLFNSKVNI